MQCHLGPINRFADHEAACLEGRDVGGGGFDMSLAGFARERLGQVEFTIAHSHDVVDREAATWRKETTDGGEERSLVGNIHPDVYQYSRSDGAIDSQCCGVTYHEPRSIRESNCRRQRACSVDERRSEIDPGDPATSKRREAACRSPDSAADIEEMVIGTEPEVGSKCSSCNRSSEVELIDRREIVDPEVGVAERSQDRTCQIGYPGVVIADHPPSPSVRYCRNVAVVRRLEGPELTSYNVLDTALAKRVRIVTVPVLPRGASGMTIGRWIFLKDDGDHGGGRELMAHELVHVRQYAEFGYLRFSVRYLRHYALGLLRHRHHRDAHLSIPAEVEALADARAWRVRNARSGVQRTIE